MFTAEFRSCLALWVGIGFKIGNDELSLRIDWLYG